MLNFKYLSKSSNDWATVWVDDEEAQLAAYPDPMHSSDISLSLWRRRLRYANQTASYSLRIGADISEAVEQTEAD